MSFLKNPTGESRTSSSNQPRRASSHNGAEEHSSGENRAVIIIGPPWPRSGTARVIQNQIDYYRQRGFHTFFVAVPFHHLYMQSKPIWDQLNEGIQDLGADQIFVAALELKRYKAARYIASLRHAFRGTILDWMIAAGRSAQLPADVIQSFCKHPIALLHVNHVYTLGFALRLREEIVGRGLQMPIILETHDIQSQVLQEKQEPNPWTHKPDRMERLIRSEISPLKNVDVLVHLSVNDFEFFHKRLPSKPHVLAMPTIDEAFVSAVNSSDTCGEIIDLLFVGQSHGPNLEAMKWFFSEVWPRLAQWQYRLKVVGQIEMFVRKFLPGVYEEFHSCFVGEVADLAPYYRSARCVIAPMVSGTGISIKTIEALALGKPFVGTSKAYRGMPMQRIQEVGLRAYDSPQEFADGVVYALANDEESRAQSAAAYDRIFSTVAAFASRDQAFDLAMKLMPANS
jgi:polysaccharide biosynthesis protein PslH